MCLAGPYAREVLAGLGPPPWWVMHKTVALRKLCSAADNLPATSDREVKNEASALYQTVFRYKETLLANRHRDLMQLQAIEAAAGKPGLASAHRSKFFLGEQSRILNALAISLPSKADAPDQMGEVRHNAA